MNETIHVLGFAGSLRKDSYNRALLRVAYEVLPQDMHLETFDLAPLPLYNSDVEVVSVPEPVQKFKTAIAQAQALLIATPEYNYSISGVLKNAIDWASRPPKGSPLNGKPVAIMGASGGPSGTMRAQMHLRQICVFTNMLPLNKPEVYVMRATEKFDAEGKLIDEPTRQRVRELLEALAIWTRRLQQ